MGIIGRYNSKTNNQSKIIPMDNEAYGKIIKKLLEDVQAIKDKKR